MSSSVRVPAEWNGTIDKIVARIQRRPTGPARPGPTDRSHQPLLTGLIYGPRASGKSRTIPPAIHNALADSTTLVVHVSNQLEVGLLNLATDGSANLGFSLHRASYEGFLQTLRLNTAALAPNSQHGQGDRRRAWLQSGILPPKVVILVDEDTSLSASFCLMLVELLGWAGAISQRPGLLDPLAISIFIMGCSETNIAGESFLSRAQNIFNGSSLVPAWRLTRPIRQGQYLVSDADLNKIKYNIGELFMKRSNTPLKLGIICFPPWDRARTIVGPNPSRFKVDEYTIVKDFEFIFKGSDESNVASMRLICLPHDFRAPLQVEGVNAGIVLTSSHFEQQIIDGLSGRNLLSCDIQISKAQQLEQESWAYRFSCPASDVTVYNGAADQSDDAFDAPRRAKVDDEHLAGFLAALSMSDFGGSNIGTSATATFCSDKLDQINRMTQLSQMGICRISDTLDSVPEPRLTGSIRSSFCELLPMFNYDPRLALFIALPCDHYPVASVKLQLAALIKVGLHKIFCPSITRETNHAEFRQQLSRHLRGYSTKLNPYGSLWTLLAIWKAAASRSESFSSENPAVDQRATVDVGEGLVKVTIIPSRAAIELMSQAAKLLDAHQNVHIHPHDLYEDNAEWTYACTREIQRHLMLCFAHSAVMAVPTTATESNPDEPWHFFDTSSRGAIFPSGWHALVDVDQCAEEQPRHGLRSSVMIGLSLAALQIQGEESLRFLDWTWILPVEYKARLEANCQGQSIQDALLTTCDLNDNLAGL